MVATAMRGSREGLARGGVYQGDEMSETLKPCPFCGSYGLIQNVGEGCIAVSCVRTTCFQYPARANDTDEGRAYLIERWNRRAAPALSKEVREALEYYESRHGDYDESQRHKAYIRSFLSASTKGK